ncbi:hypothetical protein CsatB_004620 [Cannabis sativa]
MKKFLSMKSFSRSRSVVVVHDEDDEAAHDEKYDNEKDVVLTVWRKSLLMSCNGFTVIDSHGNLIYRVDNYMRFRPQEITLMDSSGKSILTFNHRPTKLGLVDSWVVYEGERLIDVDHNNKKKINVIRRSKSLSSTSKKPIFYIKKNINYLYKSSSHVLAHVFRCGSSDKNTKRSSSSSSSSCGDYVIEGSYTERSCKVLDKWCNNKVVAEIRRKQECVSGISFGNEVFHLIVHPNFDPTFAMAFLMLLDQMFS